MTKKAHKIKWFPFEDFLGYPWAVQVVQFISLGTKPW
ncbi:hypothetical protein C21_01490 [Arenibacter sp. NBRC 103722]|nr:hypothetical protein C21_01490 [Arenibacter sp. NBRC 103722]